MRLGRLEQEQQDLAVPASKVCGVAGLGVWVRWINCISSVGALWGHNLTHHEVLLCAFSTLKLMPPNQLLAKEPGSRVSDSDISVPLNFNNLRGKWMTAAFPGPGLPALRRDFTI